MPAHMAAIAKQILIGIEAGIRAMSDIPIDVRAVPTIPAISQNQITILPGYQSVILLDK